MTSRKSLVRRNSLGVLGCLAITTGCEPDARPESEFLYQTHDSAGVFIAENSGLPAPEDIWSVDPTPLVSIGGVSAPPPALFEVVTQAVRLGDGRIVVLENQTSELRFFDENGDHLKTAGGHGEGPGEFEYASSFVRLAGDTLLIDAGDRFILFGPAGEYLGERRIDTVRYFSGRRLACGPSSLLADGSFIFCEIPSSADIRDSGSRPLARVIRVARDETESPLGLYVENFQRVIPEVTWIASGGSPPIVATMHNLEYSVRLWSLDGRLLSVVRRQDARRSLTGEEVTAVVEFAEQVLGLDLQDEQPPTLVPAASGLTVGITGDIWIRREPFLPSFLPTQKRESVFDVFDSSGRFRGEVRFEGYFWLYEVGDDYVLGMRLDELDVPHIQLHRLFRGDGQPSP